MYRGKARRPNAIYDKRWTNCTALQLVHRLDPVFFMKRIRIRL